MNLEIAEYIIKYYSKFLNEKENLALRHINSLFKLDGDSNSSMYNVYKQKGWITTDKKALDLIKNGLSEFYLHTANRISKTHKDEVFLNNCPKCQKLSRTPKARQCRHCGNKWHVNNDI